jgi:hypothetical protein
MIVIVVMVVMMRSVCKKYSVNLSTENYSTFLSRQVLDEGIVTNLAWFRNIGL